MSQAPEKAPEKRGALGSLTLLGLGVNGIVGVGIFVAPKSVAAAVENRALTQHSTAMACAKPAPNARCA